MSVMLAHCYDQDKHEKIVDGWWMSIKYDGVRAVWDGINMKSRTGKIYTLPDFLSNQLKTIVDTEGKPIVLDGELWAGNDTFAFMSGLARKYENNDELWKQVKYMVFDTIPTIPTTPFEDRIRTVQTAIQRAKPTHVKGVKFHKLKLSETNVMDELIKVEKDGGEGIVLRRPGSLYTVNRSHDMLKVKSWRYTEAEVLGYIEGTGKYKGMVGSLAVKSDQVDDENPGRWVSFKVGSGLNDWQRYAGNEECEEFPVNWKNQKAIDNNRKNIEVSPANVGEVIIAKLIETIKTKEGKEQEDAMHSLNSFFPQMPVIGDRITFRFKELTKDGNPSMPTFVGVRNYE
jgi:DNA ligase-1